MDTENYKQAVLGMYTAMQEVFAANEKLQRLTQIVWDWDKQAPSPIAEAPSLLLPPSPPSEPEEEAEDQPCGCASDFWKPCVHECSVCLKALTLKDSEGICWMCEEDLVTVPNDYPEDAAAAKQNSRYRDGAFHALVLRIRANNCREAADDTDDAEEISKCLQEAKQLDARASDLLYNTADSRFEPWWFTSWDYWMQPGSSYKGKKPVPASAPTLMKAPCGIPGHTISIGTLFCLTCWPSEPAEVEAPEPSSDCLQACNIVNGFHVGFCRSAPTLTAEQVADDLEAVAAAKAGCVACTAVNGFHVGKCWSEALTVGGEQPSIMRQPCGFDYLAPAPKRSDYNNRFWPSPRPKLFANRCAPLRKFKTHQEALEFLAQRAKITVEALLETSPDTYVEKYMGGMKYAPLYWQQLQPSYRR